MAAGSDADISSDEETLSSVKQKSMENKELNNKKHEYSEYSDEETIIPEVLVKVEVEEMDESEVNYDYSMTEDPLASTSKRVTRKRTRKYSCSQCDAVFESAKELREHSKEHVVETRNECEYCGRCFKKAVNLRMHLKVHGHGESKCPICGLLFTQKLNLGKHLMTHEKTEECTKCPAKFYTRKELKSHLRTHSTVIRKRARAKDKMNENSDAGAEGPNLEVRVKTEAIDSQNENPYEYESLKRDDLDYNTQCAIVNKMHKARAISDICRLYNVTPEVVNEIWEERDNYTIPKKNGKKNTKYLNSVLDSKILEWLNNQKATQTQVTGRMLQDVAESIAKDVGFIAFDGSKKWLDRFKTRYKVTLRTHRVKRDAPSAAFESKWKKAFFNEQWTDAKVGFEEADIYTADEVGLYYNVSKGRIKKHGGRKYIHGYVKDRASILMCTNATGTDKKKLLVCAVDDPLIHSHRDVGTLPVDYIRHSEAHFTTAMFEDYVKKWNSELEKSDKKALLILDRATIHTKMKLSHLKLCFVPWKASVGLIPIKNGVFNKFRDEFRRLLLEEKVTNVLKGVDRNLTCLEALYMFDKAWERVPPCVISNSFKAAGYDIPLDYGLDPVAPEVIDDEAMCQMLKDYDVEPYFTDLIHLDMYLTVDEELVVGQGTNYSVFGGNHKAVPLLEKETGEVLPISTELPLTSERESAIKKDRAMEDLEIVRRYLRTNDTGYETYCHFMEVERFLYENNGRMDS